MVQRTGVSFDSASGTSAAIAESPSWDEAYRRIDAYLAALGIGRAIARHGKARQVVERVAAAIQNNSERLPVEASMEELRNELTDWLGQSSEMPELEIFLQSRLTLLLADAPELLHTGFHALPPQHVARLHEKLQLVPHCCPGRIDVQKLQLGLIPQLAAAALYRLERVPWLRFVLVVAAFIAIFGFLFCFTR